MFLLTVTVIEHYQSIKSKLCFRIQVVLILSVQENLKQRNSRLYLVIYQSLNFVKIHRSIRIRFLKVSTKAKYLSKFFFLIRNIYEINYFIEKKTLNDFPCFFKQIH